MIQWSDFLRVNTIIFLSYTSIVTIFYFIMFIFSFRSMKKEKNLNKVAYHHSLNSIEYTKPVSILVPAYNEEAGILQSVRSLIALNYPQLEVIVINDGSKDETANKLIEHFKMVPSSQVFQKRLNTKPIKQVYTSTIVS